MIFSIKRFNKTLRTGNFSDKLKLADITPVLKRVILLKKENGLLVFYPLQQRSIGY